MGRGRGEVEQAIGPIEFNGSGSMELGEFKALVKMAFAQMEEGLASASASAQLAVPMPVTRESMLLVLERRHVDLIAPAPARLRGGGRRAYRCRRLVL